MESFPQQKNKKVEKSTLEENKIEKPQINEGADFVFKQYPELVEIGTEEQYSEYTYTIFPDSKIKNIFYHGTASKSKIENFDSKRSNFAKAVFFTKDRKFAESFAFDDSRNGAVQEQVLDIKNPFDFSNKEHIQELKPIIEELVKEGYKSENTGIVFRNDLPQINIGEREIQNPSLEDFVNHYMWRIENGSWRIIETDRIIDFISKKYDSILINEKGTTNIAIFNADQIHVLGSKNDIEKFKSFIENRT
jgi:hypothetical protein